MARSRRRKRSNVDAWTMATRNLDHIQRWCSDRAIRLVFANHNSHWMFHLPNGKRVDWWPSTGSYSDDPGNVFDGRGDWPGVRGYIEKRL